ncbi:MAG: Acg family FMN-binding oxidoreductase [Candidatus Competibacterales bacterium]
MKRRTFIKSAGVLTVLVAGGGVWRAYDQGVFSIGQGPAYEPWKNWREDASQGPLGLVRAAILAANPHNTQPWLFKVMEGRIELYADTIRNLGAFDPYLREMHLGLGCAVENMALAATANGYEAEVTLSEGTLAPIPSTPEPTLVARIDLSPGKKVRSSLYEAIPQRHTNRGAYNPDRPLSPEVLSEIRRIAEYDSKINIFVYTAEADKAKFGDAVTKATEAIIADATMVHDSETWFRHSWADIQKFRDGPTLDAAGLSPLITAIAKILPPPSAEMNHRYWLDATRDVHVATSPMFGLLAVHDLYDRAQTMRAGRVWQRMHLWATSQGIAMQPLNQPVELVDRERELNKEPHAAQVLADLTGTLAWKPTFAFRAGYPEREALTSPRRPVEQVVVQGR